MLDYIIGYGINKLNACENACDRGLPESYDYFFKEEENLDDFLDNLTKSEFINKYSSVVKITVNDIIIILRDKDYNDDFIIQYLDDNFGILIDDGDIEQSI